MGAEHTDKHLRTVQRAVKIWRGQQARQIIIDALSRPLGADDLPILENAALPLPDPS